jgi:hypothetical protein
MKDIDTLFIKQLAPMVPIIPIIAKADTMTVDERNHFMAEVYSVFTGMTTGPNLEQSPIYRFSSEEGFVTGDLEFSTTAFGRVVSTLVAESSESEDFILDPAVSKVLYFLFCCILLSIACMYMYIYIMYYMPSCFVLGS